jgi:hypothetical protein
MLDNIKDFVSPVPSSKRELTFSDFERAAKRLGLAEIAIIQAVAEVESAGSGFYSNGLPKILFEAHVFNRRTNGKYLNTESKACPGTYLAVEEWTPSNYPPTRLMYAVLMEAMALDKEAALRSTSWNKMQILGNNYSKCGNFRNVEQFVGSQIVDEANNLDAFVNFVLSNSIDDELRVKNWAGFAYIYNGKGYRKNRYDTRMQAAYEKFAEANKRAKVPLLQNTAEENATNPRAQFTGLKTPQIASLQKWLNKSLPSLAVPLVEDGTFGRRTNEALNLAVKVLGSLEVAATLAKLGLHDLAKTI